MTQKMFDEVHAEGKAEDRTPGDGAPAAETPGDGPSLENQIPAGESPADGPDHEAMREIRLVGFLRELVRVEGRMEAAQLLGVNYRTLVRAEESGEMTGRMRDALGRLLGAGDDAEAARMREQIAALEARVEDIARDVESGLAAIRDSVAGRAVEAGSEDGVAPADIREALAGDGDPAAVAGLPARNPAAEHRPDPEVVTTEPAPDDPEVYGEAWPLVAKWRDLRAGHPDRGVGLSWLATEERLLELELAMLEEHGLTLPPETQPLRGFGRRGQTGWRRKALADARRALGRRRALAWLRRVCTFGLWT